MPLARYFPWPSYALPSLPQAQGVAYALDAPDEQGGEPAAAAAARAPPLPLSVAPHQCSVRVSYWEQVGEVLGCDLVDCRTPELPVTCA